MFDLGDIEPEFWREGAGCATRTDVDFFATDDIGEISRAKAICAACPVLDDCLAFAIETNQPSGVWGGHTSDERKRLRRIWLKDLKQAG